ncbi:MAG: glutamine amidotransferase, partial [Proteobacteria bacterium]|nr:glutamine amidotransferase [Pseudomonadota bacterium]
MTKPFLVIQLRPEDETADDEFAAILRYGGLDQAEVIRHRLDQTPLPVLQLDDLSGILVGGSPFDVSTPLKDKTASQLRVEADFDRLFDQVVPADFPFLGACSGNGLLGRYCGANISRRFGEPVGAVDVTLTAAGRIDPLLKGLPDRLRVLLGHKEACDEVPAGATLLASGERCPVQMFRVGRHVYATQFHPEADAAGFGLRINVYRDHGYFPPETANALIREIEGERVDASNQILKRFVERYR